jgi:glycosyltransferase involved in cell wall biosynthesis
MFYFNAVIMCLAAHERIPNRIAHIHPVLDVKDLKGTSIVRALYRRTSTMLIYTYATNIVSASRSTLQEFRKSAFGPRREETVIYSAIDLQPFARTVDKDEVRRSLNLPLDRPLICYVARFMPHKNHDQVLRVADLLNLKGLRFHFALAGTHGTRLDALKQAVNGRSDVSLLIGLDDISELLMASDLFFFPSLEEGFGMVAVEAAAAGLPIVATGLSTIREATPPCSHRFMFPANDDEAAATHIQALLLDESSRAAIAEESRPWAQGFSSSRFREEIESLYASTVGERK